MEVSQLSIERLMDAISRFGNYNQEVVENDNQEVIKKLCRKQVATLKLLDILSRARINSHVHP